MTMKTKLQDMIPHHSHGGIEVKKDCFVVVVEH